MKFELEESLSGAPMKSCWRICREVLKNLAETQSLWRNTRKLVRYIQARFKEGSALGSGLWNWPAYDLVGRKSGSKTKSCSKISNPSGSHSVGSPDMAKLNHLTPTTLLVLMRSGSALGPKLSTLSLNGLIRRWRMFREVTLKQVCNHPSWSQTKSVPRDAPGGKSPIGNGFVSWFVMGSGVCRVVRAHSTSQA